MKIGSNKNINRAKAKSQSLVRKSRPYWLNSADHKTTKDCYEFQQRRLKAITTKVFQKSRPTKQMIKNELLRF